MRNAVRFTGSLLVALLLAVPAARAQDHSSDSDSDRKSDGPKHYLTFQIGYRGTASKLVQGDSGRIETTIEVDSRFSGSVEVAPTEAYDLPTDQSAEAQMKRAEALQAAVLAGDVAKLTQATPPLLVTWFPQGGGVEITGRISEAKTVNAAKPEIGESRATSDLTSESYAADKVFPGTLENAFVKIRAEEKRYDIQFLLMPDMAETQEAVRQTLARDHKEEGHNTHSGSESQMPLDAGPSQLSLGYSNYSIAVDVKGLPLAGDANELIGTTRIPVPKPEGWAGSWDIALEVSWQIDITLPPLELVITAPGYDNWRPEGNIKKPTEPGNQLVARATLRPKEGQGRFVPRVKSIRFQLLDSSREPGICMNWPLDAEDRDYDLRLAAVSGGTLSRNDQALEVTDPKRNDAGQAYAEAQIDSYDFGGRASLRAVCILADGREIEGVMKSADGDQELPRLPRMKAPGWIADSWRKANQAEKLADDDDEEKVDGQTHNGDGFTLYEEYRGFVENGKHVSGDPKRKDFFILNLADVTTRSGIALFERLAKMRVHARLKDGTEMTQEKRLMNGNHRGAPHRVDQHGVVLSHVGMGKGGNTIGVEGADGAKSFRPRYVNWIFVEEPGASRGLFAAYSLATYNLDHLNSKRLYAAAVAHELLHSIGVDHHGEWLMQVRWAYFQGAEDPMNPTHKMRFTDSWAPGAWYFMNDAKRTWADADRGDTLTLLWEDDKKSLADERVAAFGAALAKERASIASNPSYGVETATELARLGKSAEYWREYLAHELTESDFNFLMFVGRFQGTDSGDESCVMRYYFATAHEDRAEKNTFYVMRPGVKQVAVGICASPQGTGGNAASHDPQSRFGPAAGGRGNCFAEICPNDAIPPRSIVIQ